VALAVALGALPIILGAVAAFVLASGYNASFHTNELGFVTLLAVLVWILEITSFVCAHKDIPF